MKQAQPGRGGIALSAPIPRASEGAPWVSALSLPPHLPIRRRSGGLLWFALWAGSEVDSGSALCYLCEPGQVHPEKPQAPHSYTEDNSNHFVGLSERLSGMTGRRTWSSA